MRVATIVSLGASAVLGIGALLAAKLWLPSSEKDKLVQTAPVVVASRPIAIGPKLDEKHLADGVRRALAEQEQLGVAGLERARAFTWRSTAERTLEVYREALA